MIFRFGTTTFAPERTMLEVPDMDVGPVLMVVPDAIVSMLSSPSLGLRLPSIIAGEMTYWLPVAVSESKRTYCVAPPALIRIRHTGSLAALVSS